MGDTLRNQPCNPSSLEAEYNYRTSDEAIDEDIVANEYEFDEDGAVI